MGTTGAETRALADAPRTLATRAERARRVLLLGETHVAPLAAVVREFRRERAITREIPQFDPLDGGIEARVLFVLEAPGRKAVESGFVSRNNDDSVAESLFNGCNLAGLPRGATVVWSLVPWLVTKDDLTVRSPTQLEIARAKPYLERVLALLPRLEVIVLFGLNAQRSRGWIASLQPGAAIVHGPHPSPLVMDRTPDGRERLDAAFRDAAALLTKGRAADPPRKDDSASP